ncbi:MarR family winged helix-turn-helix transcriptional regulator [Streptomyces sp. NPDC102476]|uniref:MarR family winged helix-turn-helix transcriptional regulator n=1 Tax=Streptomyces sp. NPDC102476 TaxID=3366181 RepID=UPI0038304531
MTSNPAERPPPGRPALLLLALGRIVRDEVERALEAQGLSLRLLSALGHLSREPGLSYSALGRRAGVTAQSMQATVRQLEQAGAVRRVTPAGRGRTAELRVTDVGRQLLGEMDHVLSSVEDPLLEGLTAEEQASFGTLLHRLLAKGLRADLPGGS